MDTALCTLSLVLACQINDLSKKITVHCTRKIKKFIPSICPCYVLEKSLFSLSVPAMYNEFFFLSATLWALLSVPAMY